MAQERDNVKAGLFVLLGIVLTLTVVFVLSDFERLFEQRQRVKVRYSLRDGLQGLKEGATVTLGDVPVGEVVHIRDERDEQGRVVSKIVEFSMPRRYQMYQNAVVEINAPPLGSGTKLNIRSVGADRPLEETKPIAGGRAASPLTKDLMADAGIGDLQREQIQQIIANVRDLTGRLKEDAPKISASLQETLAKAKPLLEDGQKALADLKAASADVKALTADVRQRSGPWLDRVDSLSGSADDSLKRVNALIKEKDPDVRKAIENARDISQQARDKTMAQITEALETANAALANAKKITQEFEALVVGQRPVLERMMANFQLTSDQLKLAAIEIRRSPWRLLYKPSDEELNTDNLYDAARSFALAAGTLDAASKSLQTVSRQQPADKEQIAKMLDHLEALFKRYETAEEAFWKALQGRRPEGK